MGDKLNAGPGRRIGLLGGSFDPPHEGHVHISRWALRRFRLHEVWWIASPGNPLKENGPAPLARRIEACRALAPPRVRVTDIEAELGTRYTADTLAALKGRWPCARFVWLMGADNLAQLHQWRDWEWIMGAIPIGVLARPDMQMRALRSPAARRYRRFRARRAQAGRLAAMRAPAWCLLTGRMSDASSTEIRARGDWP